MSKRFEGVIINFEEDFSLNVSPSFRSLDLSSYDIKSLQFKYEHNLCGCCEGNHEEIEIKLEDLFEFVNSGGNDEIKELNKEITKITNEKTKISKELKKYKDILDNRLK